LDTRFLDKPLVEIVPDFPVFGEFLDLGWQNLLHKKTRDAKHTTGF